MSISLISILLFFIIAPYCIGLLITYTFGQNKDSFALNIVCGYLVCFGSLEIISLVCYIYETTLTFLVLFYIILSLCTTFFSIIINRKRIIQIFKKNIHFLKENKMKFVFILSVFIILAQTYFVTSKQHIDDDDAYDIAVAETAVSTDSIMQYDPYTGYASVQSSRSVLSPFQIYHAVMSKLIGIKPVEYAHTVHPIFMIPLGYIVIYLMSTVLFRKEHELRAYFLLIVAIINMFSNYSVYSQGTFFMFRIWQGKAMLCSIIIPALFYFTLGIKEKITFGQWMALFFAMLSSCFVSSMGIILGAIFLGCMTVAHFVSTRNWMTTFAIGSCVMPNAILMVIYMYIR